MIENNIVKIKLHPNFVNDLKLIISFTSGLKYRPILTNVSIEIRNGEVIMVATDSYRLIHATIGKIEDKDLVFEGSAYPKTFFEYMIKEFKKCSGHLELDIDSKLLSFYLTKDSPKFYCSPAQGQFPKTENFWSGKIETPFETHWIEQFTFLYKRRTLYASIELDNEGEKYTLYINRDFFKDLEKMFIDNTNAKLFHSKSAIAPIMFMFEHNFNYKILLLPVRVD